MSSGHSGEGHLSYSKDLRIMVGMGAPNTHPVASTVHAGISYRGVDLEHGAATTEDKTLPTKRFAKNSWLSYGGKFTVAAGNLIEMTCGSGGFTFQTSGTVEFNTVGFCVVANVFRVKTESFEIGAVNSIIRGKKFIVDAEETSFQNQVTFNNNVVIKGGLFVSGETFNSHSTTTAQENLTSDCDSMGSHINPAQSFMLYQGVSNAAKASIGTKYSFKPINTNLKSPFGFIDALLYAEIPGIESNPATPLPIKIAFPYGISMVSDGGLTMVSVNDIINFALNKARISNDEMPDTLAAPHAHYYVGSGSANGTQDLTTQAAQCGTNNRVNARQSILNNAANPEAAQKDVINRLQEGLEKKTSKYAGYLNLCLAK